MQPPKIKPTLFVLKSCRIREDRFVPTEDEPLTLSWKQLCQRFAPKRNQSAVLCLRGIRMGGYLGTVGKYGTLFFLANADRTGKLNPMLVKNKSWVSDVKEVFFVETADWGAQVTE